MILKEVCSNCGERYYNWLVVPADYVDKFKKFCSVCGSRIITVRFETEIKPKKEIKSYDKI